MQIYAELHRIRRQVCLQFCKAINVFLQTHADIISGYRTTVKTVKIVRCLHYRTTVYILRPSERSERSVH